MHRPSTLIIPRLSKTWLTIALLALICALAFAGMQVRLAHAGIQQTYLVLFKQTSVAAGAITAAGGTIVYSYDAIGVAIASSDNPTFASDVARDNRVEGASATASFGTGLSDDLADTGTSSDAATPNTPAPGFDNLSGLQWDMTQIHAFEAHNITGGSSSVVVGDIDTGLDFTHPDLAPNVDFADSASCIGGVPNTSPSAWMDDNGHGTHTAGTIAAARNGLGIVGVAPNVKIASIKAGNAAGFFFPEAVICAFMWAGSHHIQVTNNSYFADPWLFNCKNDPTQRAIWKAERRAIRYAMQQGTVVVAAEGNQSDDLAHPTADATSPDDTNPVLRSIHNDCAVVPVEVAGVIGVTADGNNLLKSFYSSYGVGTVQVIAPGGDSVLQRTAAAPNGRVLSTWPAALINGCARKVFDGAATYCYAQGTSMASPHVAGVVALIMSMGVTSPGAVTAKLTNSADPMACPDTSIYAPFPAVDNGAPQVCQGGTGYNSFNGKGQANALAAVSH
ncbi:MAG TPA: S8 family serine peptidase [Ktedonobacterales bacterium]|jgi:subtilisin family serine protease